MGFMPEDAEWFLANIVTSIVVEGNEPYEIEVALVLINAKSAEEAYLNAVRLGRERELDYLNTDYKTVSVKYLGLKDLSVIHDRLENGAELAFERIAVAPGIQPPDLVSRKEDLGVFRPYSNGVDPRSPG